MNNDFPEYILDLENNLTNLFRKIKERHVKDASELNLSLPQFVCLNCILKLGKIKMSEVANFLCLSYASATNLVNRLVDAGLVIRFDSPEDRRIVMVDLTEKGTDFVNNIKHNNMKKLSDICSNMKDKDIKTMLKGVNILSEIWTEFEKK